MVPCRIIDQAWWHGCGVSHLFYFSPLIDRNRNSRMSQPYCRYFVHRVFHVAFATLTASGILSFTICQDRSVQGADKLESPGLIEQIKQQNTLLLDAHPLHVVVQYFERSDGQMASATRCEYWRSEDGLLAIISKESRQTALGFNAEYGFAVEQEEEAEKWTLRKISTPDDVLAKLQGHLSNALVSSYVEFQPLFSLIPDNNEHYSVIEHNDQIELTISKAPKSSRPRYVNSGTVWLDPKHSYAVTKFDLEIVSPIDSARVTGECHYDIGHSESGYPTPQGRTLLYYGNSLDPSERVEIISSIERFAFDPPPVDRFRLTSFGLPEPELPSISLSWIILIVAGFFLFVIVGAFRTKNPDVQPGVAS